MNTLEQKFKALVDLLIEKEIISQKELNGFLKAKNKATIADTMSAIAAKTKAKNKR